MKTFGIHLLILCIYGICFFYRASAFPLADEIDFTLPMAAWVEKGPQAWGLWHAPFYPWLLMVLGKIYGTLTPALARSIGGISIICAAVFQQKSSRSLDSEDRLLLWTWTLLSPVALGAALLLDYDNTLLAASTAIFFWAMVRYQKPQFSFIPKLGFILGLCLMSKETTPLIYPLGLVVAWRTHWGWRKSFMAATLVGLIGVFVFLAATWLWCLYYHLPLAAVFDMDLLGLKTKAFSQQPVSFIHEFWAQSLPALWMGLPLIIMAIITLPRNWRNGGGQAGIAVVSFAVLFVYTFILKQRTYQFPKYMVPILLWLPWLVAMAAPQNAKSKVSHGFWYAMIVGAILFGPAPLNGLYERTLTSLLVSQMTVIAVTLFWVAAKFSGRLPRFFQPPEARIFVLIFGLGFSSASVRTALFTQRSLNYWYGEQATTEARYLAQEWKHSHPNGKIIATSKDLAYALRQWDSLHITKDILSDQHLMWCESKQDVLIVTRSREDSSLLREPLQSKFHPCLQRVHASGKDVIAGEILAHP